MISYHGDEAIDWFGLSRLWIQTVGCAVTTSRIDSLNRTKTLNENFTPARLLLVILHIDFFVYCTYNNINRTLRTSQRCAPGETFFIRRYFLNEVKSHLSYEGQIDKLYKKGYFIESFIIVAHPRIA